MAKSIKKNAFYSFLKSFMTLFFPLITFPYASRILGPEGIGKINFAGNVISYFAMIAALGIGSYATRQAAKIRDDRIALSKFVKEIFLINIASTVISYILFFVAIIYIRKFDDYRPLLYVCSLQIFFNTIGFNWFYTALEEFKYITLRTILFQIIGIGFLFGFVRTRGDLVNYAIFGIITGVGSNICNFFYLNKFIDWKQKAKLEIKKHLKPIFIFFGMSVSITVYTALDSVMLGFLTNDKEVGIYSAATKLNKMILSLLTAVISILLPRLSYYFEQKRTQEFKSLVQKGICFVMLLSFPMIAGLIFLSPSLIALFCGSEYSSAIIPMRIITPVLLIISTAYMTSQVLSATEKEKFSLVSYTSAAVLNLILNFIFIPKFGASGAALGTVFAELTATTIQMIITRKYFFTKKTFICIIQSLASVCVMSVATIFVCSLIENTILKLAAGTLTGICIYAHMLLLLRNEYFTEILKQLKSKIMGRMSV